MMTIPSLVDELANCPLILGGAFFTVAVKKGSSELIHLNLFINDDLNDITWVVPLGDWKGGEFCVPHTAWHEIFNSSWPNAWGNN